MKKFTKICLITALILILVGGTICVIGVASGGWKQVDEIGGNSSWAKMLYGVSHAYTGNYFDDIEEWADGKEDWISDSTEYENYGDGWDFDMEGWGFDDAQNWDYKGKGIAVGSDYSQITAGEPGIKTMYISIGGAALYIKEAQDGNFGIQKEGKGIYEYYEEDGVLHLIGNHKNRVNDGEKVYLYIPEGAQFEKVAIAEGAGLADLGKLDADEIELQIGAGMATSDNINCSSLKIDIGAGKVTLGGVKAQELDMNVGVGHAYVEADITKEINVDCGLGAVELVLSGSEKDYNYKASCDAGSINIGDKIYGALSSDAFIDNDAEKDCSLECAMGNIKVSFE
jgi:hypothetical protein